MSRRLAGTNAQLVFYPIRGIKEMGIDVNAADAVAGIHYDITWTDTYYFQAFVPNSVDVQGQFGGLIQGNVGSNYIKRNANTGFPAYLQHDGTGATSKEDENVMIGSNAGGAGSDPAQVPLFSCRKLSYSFACYSPSIGDYFTLEAFRVNNSLDAATFMGAAEGMLIYKDAKQTVILGNNVPNFATACPWEINVGSGFYLKLTNISSAVRVNRLQGSIFLHAN